MATESYFFDKVFINKATTTMWEAKKRRVIVSTFM